MARIIMILARGPGQPEGDLFHRLEAIVALTPQGQLDEAALTDTIWPTRRMLPDGRERQGDIVRSGAGWVLRGRAGEDSPHSVIEAQVFRPGEYVTLRPPAQDPLVFRIVDVQPD
jgi:hypothetical protein